jgi:hypothetical protein
MAQPLPRHPAVALRSNYAQLRALLAIAVVALVIAAAAAIALAADDDAGTVSHSSSPVPERVTDVAADQPRPSIGGKAASVGR